MQYIIYYLIGGLLLNLIYDLIVDELANQDLRFTTKERIIVGLVWPIYLISFIKNVFFKNNKND